MPDNEEITRETLAIARLGPADIDSPLLEDGGDGRPAVNFVPDGAKVLFENRADHLRDAGDVSGLPAFEVAGPRKKIYFDPPRVTAGIVTCGGLCPGINDVIRGLVMNLHYRYGVGRIIGFRYGYRGMVEDAGLEPLKLTPAVVKDINEQGGTILGSSRGAQDMSAVADYLTVLGVDILFTIGGDGTQRGGREIASIIRERDRDIAVVGIPKTIDNDIRYLKQSFGFETAVSEAKKAVLCSHTEAEGAPNGIGLVKLMGRRSGFIACHTALAAGVANFVLIPEVPFSLEGPGGFLEHLRRRLERRNHACIIVAEGAGQDLLELDESRKDASGNVVLEDIGLYLKHRITQFLDEKGIRHTVKYIDPSYIIRSVPATAHDSLYCAKLAHGAAHAAMSGRTGMVIGTWNDQYVHFPIDLVTSGRQYVDTEGDLWQSVLEFTGQPRRMS